VACRKAANGQCDLCVAPFWPPHFGLPQTALYERKTLLRIRASVQSSLVRVGALTIIASLRDAPVEGALSHPAINDRATIMMSLRDRCWRMAFRYSGGDMDGSRRRYNHPRCASVC